MSTKYNSTDQQQRQAGMVAIMVTLILMIVISLIVLGFAQLSRRNQRQALDRQLSTQAFYAAETGINDATKRIKDAISSGSAVAGKPDCESNGGGFYSSLNPVIDAGNSVEYTCLTVDPTPDSIVKSGIGARSSMIALTAETGTIDSLTLKWFNTDDSNKAPADGCPATKGVFPASDAWGTCGYGVLRFDLVDMAPSGGLSLTSLQNNTMTSFVVPLRPAGTGGVSSMSFASSLAGANNLLGVVCSQTECSLTINGMGKSQYYLRVSSLYREDTRLEITGANASGVVSFKDAQAVVDATGRAQDVLRRVQVRVPLQSSGTNLLSDYALQSTEAICKRFSVMDGFFQSDADTALSNAGFPGLAASNDNPLCD